MLIVWQTLSAVEMASGNVKNPLITTVVVNLIIYVIVVVIGRTGEAMAS
jgi:mannitol-specific phosphotransferase system IIBC component